jgi:hypothetical protein
MAGVGGAGSCQFENQRLLRGEIEGMEQADRDLQGGSCANCNPGPSGYWCRLITCRRRQLQGTVNTFPLDDLEARIARCTRGAVEATLLVGTPATPPTPAPTTSSPVVANAP